MRILFEYFLAHFTSSHLQICSSADLHIFIYAHLHIYTFEYFISFSDCHVCIRLSSAACIHFKFKQPAFQLAIEQRNFPRGF